MGQQEDWNWWWKQGQDKQQQAQQQQGQQQQQQQQQQQEQQEQEVAVPAKRPKFIAAPKYKKQFIAAKRLAALNAAEGEGAARDGKGRVTQVAHRSGHAGGAHRFLHMRGS